MHILRAILLALSFAVICAILLVASGGWSPVRGQTEPYVAPCGPLAGQLAALRNGYGEVVLLQAAVDDGMRLIVTVNPNGTKWTAMLVNASGLACTQLFGPEWSGAPEVLPAPPPGIEG